LTSASFPLCGPCLCCYRLPLFSSFFSAKLYYLLFVVVRMRVALASHAVSPRPQQPAVCVVSLRFSSPGSKHRSPAVMFLLPAPLPLLDFIITGPFRTAPRGFFTLPPLCFSSIPLMIHHGCPPLSLASPVAADRFLVFAAATSACLVQAVANYSDLLVPSAILVLQHFDAFVCGFFLSFPLAIRSPSAGFILLRRPSSTHFGP